MAVQPLSPATDRRLGRPLPHQLANQTRAHLSAIKSLVSKGCPLAALCGISSRFQLLSPTERQVSHALLTRSPLSSPSIGRSLNQVILVRLACVRHAASVRPEPGSNSQKIVSKQPFGCSNHLSNNLSSKYTQEFSLAVIRFKTLKQSIYCQGVCSSLRYSIYKVHAPAAVR